MSSVGLGVNIWQSFAEFVKQKTEFTTAGDLHTSGNGSLMRNAPVAVFYRDDHVLAEAMSYKQSKTAHQGEEAAECCRLLTRCVLHGIRGDGTPRFLDTLNHDFHSATCSVSFLARCEQETRHKDNEQHKLEDRNWNCCSLDFRYSPSRATEHPDYIGSCAIEAFSMALHYIWSSSSFTAAILKCANLRGDSDTTAAIAGQNAGAIYGAKSIPPEWVEAILRWDFRSDILLRARKLYLREKVVFSP
jgi:ADP-ribosylglycohydrolase